MRIAIVGLGGIGSWLADTLAKFLSFDLALKEKVYLVLADGDRYEPKNQERQSFAEKDIHENKAKAKAKQLYQQYPNINYEVIPEYINELNVDKLLPSDFIFICVDQHASRKIIAETVEESNCPNIVVISGGNDLEHGNVVVHIRRNNEDITPSLLAYDEIRNANMDEHPDRLSCEQAMQSDPQVIFVNTNVANCMLNAFYSIVSGKTVGYKRVDVDIVQNGSKPDFDPEQAKRYMETAI